MIEQKNNENIYINNYEYTANRYVLKCFNIMMALFTLIFGLNLIGIFAVEQEIMAKAYIMCIIVYITVLIIAKYMSLEDKRIKYILLLGISLTITIMGLFLTYHAVLVPGLLFLYAALYSSKPIMRYVYLLTVISTIAVVYGGYYFGLCDANMVLLTAGKVEDYIVQGRFILSEVNQNPNLSLLIYFVLPRCLIYISFMSVCSVIFEVIRGSIEKVKFQAELEKKVDEQTEEIRMQQEKVKSMFIKTITALSESVDAKDRYTSGHSKRVAQYSHMIAERLGKSKEEQEEIYRAGLLHDVGKIRVPVEIINKPGKLTEEEYNIMKLHPVTGYHILYGITDDNSIAIAAKHHHERYDGKGYPNGLSKDKIPEMARIIGVADSYDAMSSNRSYRRFLPQDVIRSEIEKGRGTQFDPVIADIMLEIIDEDKEYLLKQDDSLIKNILVVGNNENCNNMVCEILNDEIAYNVECIANIKEVCDRVSQKFISLILVDADMLNEEGIMTTNLIIDAYGTPIVIMVDENALNVSEIISEYGYDDYITKPFQPILVKEVLHNITERTHIDTK